MPSPFPTPGEGNAISTTPIPRLDWVARVADNIAKARAKGASIQLVFDGDSITDQWQSPAAKPLWEENFGRHGAFDFGISGDHTEHLLWRLSRGQAAGLKPKLIAVLIGTNNLAHPPQQTPEQVAAGVRAIVAEYRRICPEAVILVQGIFPRGELPTDPFREKVRATNALISTLGDERNVIFLDFGANFLEPDGRISKEIMPDFLHLSAKGYQIWADAIRPVVTKALAGP